MDFIEMRDKMIEHFNQISSDATHLFDVLVDKDEFYNLFLDSFPEGTNEIYRVNRYHDCSCCRGFIKGIGSVVVIKDNKMISLWDCELNDDVYGPVFKKMSDYIHSREVTDVYYSLFNKMGCHHNFEQIEKMTPKQWDHFYLELPDRFVIKDGISKGTKVANLRDTRNVFKRSLEEIKIDAIDTLLEMIEEKTLYKGEEWKEHLKQLRSHLISYNKLSDKEKELYSWGKSVSIGPVLGRIRNHSIGTLLINLSIGMDLETAVKKYEDITAPSNYKRSKPIFTQKMLDDAQKKITDLGYLDSLPRRYANKDDITINDILFCNKDAAKRIKGALDVFGELSTSTSNKSKKFDRVEEVSYESFINDILPTANEIDLYLENKHKPNFVSLIAPVNKDSKPMFKWGNGFSWGYSGNVTDSMKELVKQAGGKVDGDLRFSIQWNDMGDWDKNDLDAHCQEPHGGSHIYFSNKTSYITGGQLDVDIMNPVKGRIAVENITWADRKRMISGEYKFYVHQYAYRGGDNGFRAEIEFDGNIYSFDYPNKVKGDVPVANVTLSKDGQFSIKELLPTNVSSKKIWNVNTNNFVPVSVICYSPNHWSTAQNQVGHKHVFFMLKDCINDENPNGFFNEYLNQELYEHRKVMEALGSKLKVQDSDDQLSGLGFATDKRAEVVVKINGDKIIKVKF